MSKEGALGEAFEYPGRLLPMFGPMAANHRALAMIALLGLIGLTACPPEDPGATVTGETTTTGTTSMSMSMSASDPSTTAPSTTAPTTSETGSADSETTMVGAECGDGIVEGAEGCDDGNDDNSDGCLNSCEVARCGDGVVQSGVEECDDGNENDGDACLSSCKTASCGDNVVQSGVEECDEGRDNAFGVYGGCTPFCTLGPYCGDGLLDDGEGCDDGNDGDPSDGCVDGCIAATSCRSIKLGQPEAESGLYQIVPESEGFIKSLTVWCDMETDGGGYTFLKVDVAKQPDSPPLSAKLAEAECNKYGLHLLVPRSSDHAEAAYYLSITNNVAPVGGGSVSVDPAYMSVLAIYPKTAGESCVGKPLNSDECPEWQAGVEGPFWVTDTALPGQPSKSNCVGCSMYYEWANDGTILTYIALGQGGFSSPRFLCDVGDKIGPD